MTQAPVKFDPARLAEFAFGVDMWDTAEEILRTVCTPHSKTLVMACHSSAKTHTSAVATCVALLLGGDVVTTAPTDTQVERLLWKDIRRVLQGGRIPMAEWGTVNLKDIRLPTGEWALGFTTKPEDDGVRFQGFHSRPGSFLVVIVDEALGVAPSIFTAIEGIAASGDVRRLYLCNPTVASGPVYDIAMGDDPSWTRIRIDAFDTPNLKGLTPATLAQLSEDELDMNIRPYLVSRRWVKERLIAWGEDAPEWQSRVRGLFPDQTSHTLFPLSWIDRAIASTMRANPQTDVSAGVDVAGPGEAETVVYLRRGSESLGCEAWAKPDPRQEVRDHLKSWVGRGLRTVNVDSAGIGWYFYLGLKDDLEPFGVTVNPVNVGVASDVVDEQGDPKYLNLKAEHYWSLRERFQDGDISGAIDLTTRKQLIGMKYTEDGRKRVGIEKKEDAVKRGNESPDRAEALMLCYAPVKLDLSALYGQGSVRMGREPAHRDWRDALR